MAPQAKKPMIAMFTGVSGDAFRINIDRLRNEVGFEVDQIQDTLHTVTGSIAPEKETAFLHLVREMGGYARSQGKVRAVSL